MGPYVFTAGGPGRRCFGGGRFPFPPGRRADPIPGRPPRRPGLTRGVAVPAPAAPRLLGLRSAGAWDATGRGDTMPLLAAAYAAAMLFLVALLALP